MNEEEWLASDNPHAMSAVVRGRLSPRKLLLCACASLRSVWESLDETSRGHVEAAELAAERPLTMTDLTEAGRTFRGLFDVPMQQPSLDEGREADLVREIFGNPFRPVAVESAWLTSDVLALARGIYDERAFDRTPFLADALQDAGCDGDELLNHLRDPNATHVRGCWALDLVLGKA